MMHLQVKRDEQVVLVAPFLSCLLRLLLLRLLVLPRLFSFYYLAFYVRLHLLVSSLSFSFFFFVYNPSLSFNSSSSFDFFFFATEFLIIFLLLHRHLILHHLFTSSSPFNSSSSFYILSYSVHLFHHFPFPFFFIRAQTYKVHLYYVRSYAAFDLFTNSLNRERERERDETGTSFFSSLFLRGYS